MKMRTGRSTCRKKHSYATQEEAQIHCEALKIYNPFVVAKPYRCPQSTDDPHWHVTSHTKFNNRRKRRRR
jgi:hypothetical protein